MLMMPEIYNGKFIGQDNRKFGAVCDVDGFGDYNGPNSVQKAIDAGEKYIFVKDGTYNKVSSSNTGICIVGESWDVLFDGGTSGTALSLTGTHCFVFNVSVQTTAGQGNSYHGLLLSGSYSQAIRVRCVDSDSTGLAVYGDYSVVSLCVVIDADDNGIEHGHRSIILGNNIIANSGSYAIVRSSAGKNNFVIVGNHTDNLIDTGGTGGNDAVLVGNVSNTGVTDTAGTSTLSGNETY